MADGPLSPTDLSQHIDYLLDPSLNKTITDMIGREADKFVPVKTGEPDFGYIDDKVWLRLKVNNITEDTDQWRIYAQENFFQYYDIYVVRESGKIDHIESHDLDTPFSDRSIAYPDLVTALKLKPQEQATVFIAYWSGGSTHMALSLETADSFAAKAIIETSKNYISYGMMTILIVSSMIGLAILRMNVFKAYVAYVLVTLLYLMHGDGVAFQYIWPQFPRFNSYFMIIIGCAFVLAVYNFSQVFLQTKKYHPQIDKVLTGLSYLTPIIVIPGAFIDPQWTKQALIVMVLVSILAGTYAGLIASRTRFREVRFYLFAWGCGILTAGMMNMRHILGIDIAEHIEFDSIRVIMVVDAIMVGVGVAERYMQVVKSRQLATEQSLIDANRNLQLNTRLRSLEEQYQLAVEMAASRDKSLKDTIHDLQQPLHALRLNLQNANEGLFAENKFGVQGQEKDYNIDKAFSYLETLIANHLQQSVGGSEILETKRNLMYGEDSALDLPKVLRSIYAMFAQDAWEKGLEFKFVETSQHANIEPLVLMRIVTNIVANAIKYTPSGKILLGTRRSKDSLRVEIHDTGVGLTEAEFVKAKVRHTRLHKNQFKVGGQGFGLSIASELAQNNGLRLYRMPSRQNGTSIILEIPK